MGGHTGSNRPDKNDNANHRRIPFRHNRSQMKISLTREQKNERTLAAVRKYFTILLILMVLYLAIPFVLTPDEATSLANRPMILLVVIQILVYLISLVLLIKRKAAVVFVFGALILFSIIDFALYPVPARLLGMVFGFCFLISMIHLLKEKVLQ
jgi:cytochrome bd-type quinol oxidase subunit 2